MSDLATIGFKADTTGLKQIEKGLDSVVAHGSKAEKSLDNVKGSSNELGAAASKAATDAKRLADNLEDIEAPARKAGKGAKEATKNMSQLGRQSGQAGIQFQQFIGQVQGGQSAMLALSQQSADLGFVLGAPLIGAIVGISASLLGMVFAFNSANVSMVEATDVIGDLINDYDKLNATQKEMTKSLLLTEIRLQSEALEQLKKESLAVGVGFDGLLSSEKSIRKEKDSFTASIIKQELALTKLKSQLGEVNKFGLEYNEIWTEGATKGGEFLTNLVHTANTYGKSAKDVAIYKAQLMGATEAQIQAISAQVDIIDALEKEAKARAEIEKANTTFDKTTEALEMQRQKLILTADEFEIYSAKIKAVASGATPEMVSQIVESIKALQAQRKEFNANKKATEDLEKGLDLSGLISDIDNFGGAWSNTGNVIVDTFGTMADSIDDYMSRMSSLDKLQTEIDEKRKVEGADLIELDRQQMLLNTEKNRAELDGISSIAGAVGGLFDEKTAAAKAFAAIERAIAVAQIAMSIEKALASTTETATVVANETAKQSVLATTAVVNQGTGDPYSAFVRIAAMGALMATLVSGFNGGSGSEGSTSSSEYRQENQGTGTVLGSLDKSASLVNAFDRMEDLEIDQYAVLKDMRASLLDLNSNIKNLVSGLVSRFGNFGVDNFSGELGKTSKLDSNGYFEKMGSEILSVVDPLLSATGHGDPLGALVDSLVGSFNTTKTSLTDSGISIVSQTMEDIIESGLVDAQAYFDIKTKKKSFWGLSSSSSSSTEFQGIDEQLQHEMALIFSNIGTSINTAVDILGLEVSNNLDDFVIDIPNLSLKDLSGEEIQAELEAVFSEQSDLMATYLVPNLQDFQKVGEGLYETLIRVAQEQAIFNTSIERMGFDLSELSAVMQIEVAQSIASLVGGFENFSDLTSSFFDNFYSDAEKMTALEASLTSVFDSLGLSLTTSREDFKDLVSGLDLTTIEGQELLATLLEINPALSEYIDELERVESKRVSMNIELLELQGMSEEALALQREIELAAMDESLRALQILIYAEEDRIAALNAQETAARSALSALEESVDLEKQRLQAVLDVAKTAYDAELDRIDALKVALNAENDLRQANLDEAETALNSAFDAEISLIQQLADERINALNEERTALTATSSAMSSLISNINSSLGLDGSTDLIGALAAAQRGDFSAAQNLDVNALTNLDSSGFSSAADLNVQTAINQNRLAEISGLASGKLSETEMLIASIDKQILDTQAIADEQIATLNNQLDIMLGIDSTVLSIADASAKYRSAKTSLDALNFETELAKYDMLIESAEDVYSLHEQAYDEQIIALDNIVSTNTALLYQTFNINQSIQSIADAIITLETSLADSANYQREIAKNTTTTANAAKEAKLNGQDVRVIA